MPTGKACAQAGHCFLNAYIQTYQIDPEICNAYQQDGIGTKVTLAVRSEFELDFIISQLDQHNIPYSKIIDSGHVLLPHFTGDPIVVGIGVGPCTRDKVDFVFNKLKKYE